MTDPHPLSDDELDLAASLAIDGQEDADRPLAPGDDERIAARVVELRSVVAALGEPVPAPSADVRAGQIAAALAAAAPWAPAPSSSSEGADLAPARGRRASRVRSVAPWAAAAAAAAIVLVLVGSLTSGSSSRPTATSSSKSALAGTTGRSSATRPALPTADPAFSADGRSASSTDLGSAASADALAALARRAATRATAPAAEDLQATGTSTTPNFGQAATDRCGRAVARLHPAVGEVVLQAQATLASRPVTVLVYEGAGQTDGRRRLVAFDAATCQVLVDRAL